MKTKLSIWLWKKPEQRLRLQTPAEALSLSEITKPAFQQLISDMFETMYQARGIGLAAPQIGQSIRLAVIAREINPERLPLILINPVVTPVSHEQDSEEEGCLSLPGVYGMVARLTEISLTAWDQFGQQYTLLADGLLARAIQHEVDHLNGRLIVDRITDFTRGQHLL